MINHVNHKKTNHLSYDFILFDLNFFDATNKVMHKVKKNITLNWICFPNFLKK